MSWERLIAENRMPVLGVRTHSPFLLSGLHYGHYMLSDIDGGQSTAVMNVLEPSTYLELTPRGNQAHDSLVVGVKPETQVLQEHTRIQEIMHAVFVFWMLRRYQFCYLISTDTTVVVRGCMITNAVIFGYEYCFLVSPDL